MQFACCHREDSSRTPILPRARLRTPHRSPRALPELFDGISPSVDAGYCSFPALDLDPLWHDMGGDPEFRRIRTKAMACHERFRRAVAADVAP
jgi:hypothetical protein